jgi:hypothetical protein
MTRASGVAGGSLTNSKRHPGVSDMDARNCWVELGNPVSDLASGVQPRTQQTTRSKLAELNDNMEARYAAV